MSEKNLNSIFKNIFPQGKTSTKPGEITPQFVTAVCRVYENRSDSEMEFVIEEYGIIERTAYNSLAKCYIEASKTAYNNMLLRISELSGQKVVAASAVDIPMQTAPVLSVIPQEPVKADMQSTDGEPEHVEEPDGDTSADEAGEIDDVTATFGVDDVQPPSTVHRLDLNPAPQSDASLGGEKQEPSEEDEITKARAMPITMVGKAHDCYNWTAGRILDDMPDVIVKFTPRYSGEKKEEKAAMWALYPEAMRRCKQSA